MIRKLSNSIFTIYVYGPDGREYGSGSGFIIGSNGLCVTNFHVLENAFSAVVKMRNGEKIKVRNIVDFNPNTDLVKFRLDVSPKRSFPALKLAPKFPVRGEDVISISSPGVGGVALEYTTAKGNVAAIRKFAQFGDVIQITAPISAGSSGSPIINTKGEVIGVATFYLKGQGQNLYYAVPARRLGQMNKTRNIALVDMSKDPLETRYVKLANYAYFQKDIKRAISLLNTELKRNPSNHLASKMLGQVYYMNGRYETAMKYFENAYNISHSEENIFYYGRCIAAIGKEKGGDKQYFDMAYQLYNEVVQHRPDPVFYYEIGSLIYDYAAVYKRISASKNLKRAMDALDYSLDIYYSSPSKYDFEPDVAWIKRGEIHAAMNDFSASLVDYNNAIKIDPNFFKAYYLRGMLKAQEMNNPEAGLEDEEMALRLAKAKGYPKTVIAEILLAQAAIYYQLAAKTGNSKFISSAIAKLDEAYSITGNEKYAEIKNKLLSN
jgi:tetratricopeptide (TPR) repeat protein